MSIWVSPRCHLDDYDYINYYYILYVMLLAIKAAVQAHSHFMYDVLLYATVW